MVTYPLDTDRVKALAIYVSVLMLVWRLDSDVSAINIASFLGFLVFTFLCRHGQRSFKKKILSSQKTWVSRMKLVDLLLQQEEEF